MHYIGVGDPSHKEHYIGVGDASHRELRGTKGMNSVTNTTTGSVFEQQSVDQQTTVLAILGASVFLTCSTT